MSDKKSGGSAALGIIAVALAVMLVGVGYVGYERLRNEVAAGQAETRRVVLELKTETLQEIRSASEKAVAEIDKRGGGAAMPETAAEVLRLSAEIATLKETTQAILAEQRKLGDGVRKLTKGAPTEMMAEKDAHAPGAQTIHFPLAVSKGPVIDKRIAAIVPTLKAQWTGDSCEITVSGYSDTLGDDEKNLILSRDRAAYVAGKLRDAGLTVANVVAWGERKLDVRTLDGVKNSKNRRVVVETRCGAKAASDKMASAS